ncbi:MAG: HAMP domain-containing protein [Clostridiales bacterium]|nr:HAMP domain-containing protein [Clostridiales bacterium]
MSKNVFDYIKMGLRSKTTIEDKKQEAQLKKQHEANAFDKAFTNKTYTVAKKVLDNVEKVADYDYDALFDRVNKVIDNKLPKTTKTITPKDREYRSKEFDDKVASHPDRFNIDDYINKQKNYKDSIIEKTKKNIQKKYTEADQKHKETKEIQPDDMNNTIAFEVKLDIGKKSKEETPIIISSDSLGSVENEDRLTIPTEPEDKFVDLNDLSKQTFKETISPGEATETITEESADSYQVDEQVASEIQVEFDKELPSSEHIANEVAKDEKESLDEIKSIEQKMETPSSINEDAIDELQNLTEPDTVQEPLINEVIDDPLVDEIMEELIIDEVRNETVVDHSSSHVESPQEYTTRVAFDTEILDKQYSKEELNRHNKYYKNKKRDKFAKRMKVELEDSLIGQKKRSFKRLFKFSLSFKLSFVFMLLIVLTVVSLSIAFYLGIDYVIELKELGKLEDIQFFKDVLIVLLIIFDMAAVLICISLGTKASRELVRPIDEMTQIVNQISAKDMNRRLDVKGMHDELKELAMTFNEMLDRIENSYETQNRFTSDASHELRTPIAVIQGYINMLDRWGKADGEILDESIEAIKSESHNMKRLTEKLLLLAKADKGILEMDFKSFELNELISEISRETLMIDSSHEITNEINEVKTILADRESLKQAIRIFVDNSVKYTPEGGKISINSYINKKKIYIEIADNGIGISKEDMDNIFNRFYRVDKSRAKESGGHGLGLSIAKWIISQHKGEIEVKSELNKGTVVTLILSPIKE